MIQIKYDGFMPEIHRKLTCELIALRHYQKTSISEKNVVVIYKEAVDNGFVITAFMTSKPERISERGILWKK